MQHKNTQPYEFIPIFQERRWKTDLGLGCESLCALGGLQILHRGGAHFNTSVCESAWTAIRINERYSAGRRLAADRQERTKNGARALKKLSVQKKATIPSLALHVADRLPAENDDSNKRMHENSPYPDCVRYNPENNSTLFAVTNDDGEVVAVHEVFLDDDAKEIGRRTTGIPDEGYVRFRGAGPAAIVKDEPEEGMRLWADTGKEIWVDVTGIPDTAIH